MLSKSQGGEQVLLAARWIRPTRGAACLEADDEDFESLKVSTEPFHQIGDKMREGRT